MSLQTMIKPACPLGASEGTSSLPSPENPLPLRQILTRPVILATANLICFEFLVTSYVSIIPVMFTMSVPLGGLGFTPPQIGYILGACRASAACFMAFCFSRVVQYFGERRVYIIGMSSFIGIWILLPVLNLCAWRFKMSLSVSTAVLALALPTVCLDIAYGACVAFLR